MFTKKLSTTSFHARCLSIATVAAMLGGVLSFLSPAADAAVVGSATCSEAPLSQPFLRWGDKSSYELLSGASFEGSLTGWTMSGGAVTVSGSEPYNLTGSAGSKSLLLPAGATVQSPATCVSASYPTFRFLARNGSLLSTVLVQVVYSTSLGSVTLSLGTVALSGNWQPTAVMLTNALVPSTLFGGTARAAIRLTALTGSSQVDDIYIDPRMSR